MYGGEEVLDFRVLRIAVRRDWRGGGRVLDGGEMHRIGVPLGSVGVVVGDWRIGRLALPVEGVLWDGASLDGVSGGLLCSFEGARPAIGGELSNIEGGGLGRGIRGMGKSL